jgi:hypothetical protein
MFSKGILLSLGLSLCSVILVYLYVKNRITNIENKMDALIDVIRMNQQQQMQQEHYGGQPSYDKIVVSDNDSEEEESSDEEDDEEEENIVLNDTVELSNENVIKEEVEKQMLELTSNEDLKDMEEHILTPENDGLDDMDDLEEDLDNNVEEEDYSKLGKVQLRELCETKGFETKGKKKHELLELLK